MCGTRVLFVVTYYWQRRACYPIVPAEARTELTACGECSGPNTNNSMFVITLGAVPRMDGKNTVFGRVVNPKGLKILEVCRAHVCTGTARCS